MSWPQRSGPRGTGGNGPHAVHTGGQRGKLQLASDLLGACVHNPRSRKKRSPGETLPEGGEEEQRMGPDPALSSRCPQTAAHNAVLLLFTQLHLHRPHILLLKIPVVIYYCYTQMLFTQSCPTLCAPVDCSPPGSSVHGILQTRILEWVARK